VYIDNIDTAWWYYINKFYVCKEYPHGVAIKLKSYEPTIVLKNSIGDEYENFVTEQIENDNVEGFHGYTHRGGSTFKIGDRLFDAEYMPVVDDYDRKEFEGYWKEYSKSYSKADDFDKKSIYGDGIKAVIPFNRRGKQVIKDWDQARQAAINISKDLS
jgi:hypothetical protein